MSLRADQHRDRRCEMVNCYQCAVLVQAELEKRVKQAEAALEPLTSALEAERAEKEKRGRELAAVWRALEPSDTRKSQIAARVIWRGSLTDLITDLLGVLIDDISKA